MLEIFNEETWLHLKKHFILVLVTSKLDHDYIYNKLKANTKLNTVTISLNIVKIRRIGSLHDLQITTHTVPMHFQKVNVWGEHTPTMPIEHSRRCSTFYGLHLIHYWDKDVLCSTDMQNMCLYQCGFSSVTSRSSFDTQKSPSVAEDLIKVSKTLEFNGLYSLTDILSFAWSVLQSFLDTEISILSCPSFCLANKKRFVYYHNTPTILY